MSKINRPPISLARIVRFMKKPGRENCIAVIVGTVTDDARIFEIPKLMVYITHIYTYILTFLEILRLYWIIIILLYVTFRVNDKIYARYMQCNVSVYGKLIILF